MNIISARRAAQALQKKIRLLEKYREKARDKPKWDAGRSGRNLAVAQRQLAGLRMRLIAALYKQGQYSHTYAKELGAEKAGDE